MKQLRNIFLTAMAFSVLVLAAGDTGNGMGDTSKNGAQDGATMDTITTMGIVMEINTTDSILLLQTDTATDTFYIKENTQMPSEQELTQGTRVEVRYMDMDGRKELISVRPVNAQGASLRKTSFKKANENGTNGSNNVMKLSGTIQEVNTQDSSITLQTDQGTETIYFNKNTKMDMEQLKQGTEIEIQYKTMDGRKMAKNIKTK